MKIHRFLLPFVLASLTGTLSADDSKPPLPTGPLLKRTPYFSTWSVTVQSGAAAAKTPGEEVTKVAATAQSTVVKTGSRIFEQTIDSKGIKRSVWHVSGLRIVKPDDSANPIICPDFGGGDIYSINFAVSDFAGLDWISPTTYVGQQKYLGRDCIVFTSKVSPLEARVLLEELRGIELAKADGQPVPKQTLVPAVAFIDLETRLPLFVQFGTEKRVYQYLAAPQVELVLPAEVENPVKEYEHKMQRLSAPPSKA